jgi:hypothetical protein
MANPTGFPPNLNHQLLTNTKKCRWVSFSSFRVRAGVEAAVRAAGPTGGSVVRRCGARSLRPLCREDRLLCCPAPEGDFPEKRPEPASEQYGDDRAPSSFGGAISGRKSTLRDRFSLASVPAVATIGRGEGARPAVAGVYSVVGVPKSRTATSNSQLSRSGKER